MSIRVTIGVCACILAFVWSQWMDVDMQIWVHGAAVMFLLVCCTCLCILSGCIWMIRPSFGIKIFRHVCVIVLFSLLSQLFAVMWLEYEVHQAKQYPHTLWPVLIEYQRKHGEYPPSLESLDCYPPVPRLLRRPIGSGYQTHNDRKQWSFSFPLPSLGPVGYEYDSTNKRWRYYT